MMKLKQFYLTENACYKAGRTITPKGIMVHSTGANNPNLKRYVNPDDGLLGKNIYGNHWNNLYPSGREVCVHAFIGKLQDGSVATYQTLPWNYEGWHCGGTANKTHIGFEICEDNLKDKNYFKAVYQEALELCVYLCKLYNLTAKDIICHSEGYKKGIASNHADVMHWFPKHGKSMDTFRADVEALLSEPIQSIPPKTEAQGAVYFERYKGNDISIVNALKAIGENSSFANREKIAKENGITDYKGTAEQNVSMVNLLKIGRLVKKMGNTYPLLNLKPPKPIINYFPKYNGNSFSIVDALKAIGENSSFANRLKIAQANGIFSYIGLASQNGKLLSLLKEGTLIKP